MHTAWLLGEQGEPDWGCGSLGEGAALTVVWGVDRTDPSEHALTSRAKEKAAGRCRLLRSFRFRRAELGTDAAS
jgi:hypothetical protein